MGMRNLFAHAILCLLLTFALRQSSRKYLCALGNARESGWIEMRGILYGYPSNVLHIRALECGGDAGGAAWIDVIPAFPVGDKNRYLLELIRNLDTWDKHITAEVVLAGEVDDYGENSCVPPRYKVKATKLEQVGPASIARILDTRIYPF
jgi:hypothetical protein